MYFDPLKAGNVSFKEVDVNNLEANILLTTVIYTGSRSQEQKRRIIAFFMVQQVPSALESFTLTCFFFKDVTSKSG